MAKEINEDNEIVSIRPAHILPFARWNGTEHAYALTVDVEHLNDVLQDGARVNVVVDMKIVKRISIKSMIQTFFEF